MKFQVKATDSTKIDTDLLVVFASEGKTPEEVVLSEEAKSVDRTLKNILSDVMVSEKYEAGLGKTLLVYTHGDLGAKRVLLVGVGAIHKLAVSDLQIVAASIGRKAKSIGASNLAIAVSKDLEKEGIVAVGYALATGMILGTYTFLKHKSEEAQKKDHAVEEVILLTTPAKLESLVASVDRAAVVAQGTLFARDLVNDPPSLTTPTYLGEVARSLAKGVPLITCDVLGKSEIEKLGMGGLLGIAKGSDEEPKFIVLRYKGSGGKTVALVGKGITFDTGGLSLKPAQYMETMKLDMAGAAAILGVFKVLPTLKPKVNVVGLISATENMPSGKAIKPGDIVRAMNGKSIEVLNTDAEGRVVLSDALSYAVAKIKPSVIVDLATLTGACMVALGEDIAGLFANNQDLAKALKHSASVSGEKVWELPLASEYKEALKSTVADVKNIASSRYGGAINGALFLQEFVPDSTPWAHLDIAGPSFAEKDAPLTPHGGTGFGVQLLLEYLSREV